MINTLILHASIFHADDVFVAAMATILNPQVKIIRTFDVRNYDLDSDDDIVVCDIGGGRFDHHGEPKLREDGHKHCAATLFWERFGHDIVHKIAPEMDENGIDITFNTIDHKLLSTIAGLDNGDIKTSLYTINAVISSFNASWDNPGSADSGFASAVQIALLVLTNEIQRSASVDRGKKIVQKAIAKSTDRIVVLPQFAPWQTYVCATDAQVIVFPSNRGGFNMQLVPVKPGVFDTRISTPESWHGKSGEEAAAEFDGMNFCHASGFMAAFSTLEQALKAAHYLVDTNNN